MQFLLSATLAEYINNRSNALTGAARTQLANPLTFKASGAAAAFIRCCLLFFKVLIVSSYRLGMALFSYRKR